MDRSRAAVEAPSLEDMISSKISEIDFTTFGAFRKSLEIVSTGIDHLNREGRLTDGLRILKNRINEDIGRSEADFNSHFISQENRQKYTSVMQDVFKQYISPYSIPGLDSEDNSPLRPPVTAHGVPGPISIDESDDSEETASEARSQITVSQTPSLQSKPHPQGTLYMNDRRHIELLIDAFNAYRSSQPTDIQASIKYTRCTTPQRDKKSTSASEMNTLHTFSFPDDASAKAFFVEFMRNNPGVLRDAQNNEIKSFEQIKAMQSGEALASSEGIRLSSIPSSEASSPGLSG